MFIQLEATFWIVNGVFQYLKSLHDLLYFYHVNIYRRLLQHFSRMWITIDPTLNERSQTLYLTLQHMSHFLKCFLVMTKRIIKSSYMIQGMDYSKAIFSHFLKEHVWFTCKYEIFIGTINYLSRCHTQPFRTWLTQAEENNLNTIKGKAPKDSISFYKLRYYFFLKCLVEFISEHIWA